MLAMVVNDNADCLAHSGAWASIASMLAPTGECGCLRERACSRWSSTITRVAWHARNESTFASVRMNDPENGTGS